MPSWLLLAGVCLTPSVEQRWEPLSIEARVAPVRPSVGELITLELEVEGPASLPARPYSPRDWGQLSLRSREALPVERLGAGSVRRRWRWQLQAWRLGELELPPIELRRGGERLWLPPLSIEVSSVLGEGESELRPLRAPRALPAPPRRWRWSWLLAGLALAGLLLWWQRRWRAAPATGPPPDPLEEALAGLRRLAAGLGGAELPLDLAYQRASELTRHYLGRRHGFHALGETTRELERALAGCELAPELVAELTGLLEQADLVKFAGRRPGQREARAMLARCGGLLRQHAQELERRQLGTQGDRAA